MSVFYLTLTDGNVLQRNVQLAFLCEYEKLSLHLRWRQVIWQRGFGIAIPVPLRTCVKSLFCGRLYWSMVFTGMFFILSFIDSFFDVSFFLFLWFLLTTSVWMFCVKLNLKSFWVYSSDLYIKIIKVNRNENFWIN